MLDYKFTTWVFTAAVAFIRRDLVRVLTRNLRTGLLHPILPLVLPRLQDDLADLRLDFLWLLVQLPSIPMHLHPGHLPLVRLHAVRGVSQK